MTPYANISGHSGITAYEARDESIIVQFIEGARYEYNAQRPGPAQVERMKDLAARGFGLSTYIAQAVRQNYFRKL